MAPVPSRGSERQRSFHFFVEPEGRGHRGVMIAQPPREKKSRQRRRKRSSERSDDLARTARRRFARRQPGCHARMRSRTGLGPRLCPAPLISEEAGSRTPSTLELRDVPVFRRVCPYRLFQPCHRLSIASIQTPGKSFSPTLLTIVFQTQKTGVYPDHLTAKITALVEGNI